MADGQDQVIFTVCVFQDTEWAKRGIEALKSHGFATEELSFLAKDTPETAALAEKTFGVPGSSVEVCGLGAAIVCGRLVGALQGDDEALGRSGVAATIRRVGFQVHDGFIFETLTARGGILVAIESEPRAADALTIFLSFGGGNAAIGAWKGRV
jgi:hypothetical protein